MNTGLFKLLSLSLITICICAACASMQNDVGGGIYGDEGIGLRKDSLFHEDGVEPPAVTFPTSAPGSSEVMDRAFVTAPPQIPHSTEGLLPITTGNNSCKGCHLPAVAAALKAPSVPGSHMRDSVLSNDRFSCNQCHVPQAKTKPIVDNNF